MRWYYVMIMLFVLPNVLAGDLWEDFTGNCVDNVCDVESVIDWAQENLGAIPKQIYVDVSHIPGAKVSGLGQGETRDLLLLDGEYHGFTETTVEFSFQDEIPQFPVTLYNLEFRLPKIVIRGDWGSSYETIYIGYFTSLINGDGVVPAYNSYGPFQQHYDGNCITDRCYLSTIADWSLEAYGEEPEFYYLRVGHLTGVTQEAFGDTSTDLLSVSVDEYQSTTKTVQYSGLPEYSSNTDSTKFPKVIIDLPTGGQHEAAMLSLKPTGVSMPQVFTITPDSETSTTESGDTEDALTTFQQEFADLTQEDVDEFSDSIEPYLNQFSCESPRDCFETPFPFGLALSQLCVYDSVDEMITYVNNVVTAMEESEGDLSAEFNAETLFNQIEPIRDILLQSPMYGHFFLNIEDGTLYGTGHYDELDEGTYFGLFLETPDLLVDSYGLSLEGDNDGGMLCGALSDIERSNALNPWYLMYFEYEKCGEGSTSIEIGGLTYTFDGVPCEDTGGEEDSSIDNFVDCDESDSVQECFEKIPEYEDMCDPSYQLDINLDAYGGSVITRGSITDGLSYVPETWSFGYYDSFPMLPVDAYGVAWTEDGSTHACNKLSYLDGEGYDYFFVVQDFSGYSCDGEFRHGSKEYALSGNGDCVETLDLGTYDTDGDGTYGFNDMLEFLRWSLMHKLNGFTLIRYPFDAVEIGS